MPELSTLGLFSLAALALLVVPGPSVIYVVTRSVDQGRAAGLVSALGLATGTLPHIAAAALGVSAILASSAEAFTVVKLAGAAYLIALGIRRILTREPADEARVVRTRRLCRIYAQAIVVEVLNPKTALFFLAFLPQFVVPSRGAVPLQIVALGVSFMLIGIVSDSTYALASSAAGEWLRRSRIFARAQRYVTGGVLVGLGVTAALTGHRSRPAT